MLCLKPATAIPISHEGFWIPSLGLVNERTLVGREAKKSRFHCPCEPGWKPTKWTAILEDGVWNSRGLQTYSRRTLEGAIVDRT